MKLELDLQELLELKGALIEKKNRLKEAKQNDKSDKSMSALLNADSIETINTLLQKIDKLSIDYYYIVRILYPKC